MVASVSSFVFSAAICARRLVSGSAGALGKSACKGGAGPVGGSGAAVNFGSAGTSFKPDGAEVSLRFPLTVSVAEEPFGVTFFGVSE